MSETWMCCISSHLLSLNPITSSPRPLPTSLSPHNPCSRMPHSSPLTTPSYHPLTYYPCSAPLLRRVLSIMQAAAPLWWHSHTLIGGFWKKADCCCYISHIQLSKNLPQGNSTFALECRQGILNCFQEHKTLLSGKNGWNRKVILITHTAATAIHLLPRPFTAPAARRCLQVGSCLGLGWPSAVCGGMWEPLAWIDYECGQGNSLTWRKLSPSAQLPGPNYKW